MRNSSRTITFIIAVYGNFWYFGPMWYLTSASSSAVSLLPEESLPLPFVAHDVEILKAKSYEKGGFNSAQGAGFRWKCTCKERSCKACWLM